MWSTIRSAPAACTRSRLRGLAVAVTWAPARLASWTADAPDAAACAVDEDALSGSSRAFSNSACHAVSPAHRERGASAGSTVRGAAARSSAGAATYSCGGAGLGRRQERDDRVADAPTVHVITDLADDAGHVDPGDVRESATGMTSRRMPSRRATSTGLNVVPATRTTTCPEAATGGSIVSSRSTALSPCSW